MWPAVIAIDEKYIGCEDCYTGAPRRPGPFGPNHPSVASHFTKVSFEIATALLDNTVIEAEPGLLVRQGLGFRGAVGAELQNSAPRRTL